MSKSKSIVLLKNRKKYMKILKIQNMFELVMMKKKVMNRKYFQLYQVYFLKYLIIKNFRILLELKKNFNYSKKLGVKRNILQLLEHMYSVYGDHSDSYTRRSTDSNDVEKISV